MMMFKLIYPKFWESRGLLTYAFWPLSQIYLLLSILRKLIVSPVILPARVICVGNMSVGGTGKTQIVIWLAKLFSKKEINFLVITKGYGSNLNGAKLVSNEHSALDVGDESIILSEFGTVIAAKKIAYALDLINQLAPDVIIVDDGMQNPSFHKDFTILSIDGARGIGNGFLIPAGPLRQYPKEAIKNANAIITVNAKESRLNETSGVNFNARIVPTNNRLDKTKNYFAFSGIGNPERFFSTLTNFGLKLSRYKIFPDHHNYSEKDLVNLKLEADALDAILITTKKDYVKISDKFIKTSIECFDVELSIDKDKELENLIYEAIFQKH